MLQLLHYMQQGGKTKSTEELLRTTANIKPVTGKSERNGYRTAIFNRRSEVIRAMEMERTMTCAYYTETLIKVLVEKMKRKTAWKAARANEWLKLKGTIKYIGWGDWIELILPRVGTSGRCLSTW